MKEVLIQFEVEFEDRRRKFLHRYRKPCSEFQIGKFELEKAKVPKVEVYAAIYQFDIFEFRATAGNGGYICVTNMVSINLDMYRRVSFTRPFPSVPKQNQQLIILSWCLTQSNDWLVGIFLFRC